MPGKGGTGRTPRIVREPWLVDALVEGLELNLPVAVACETAGVNPTSFKTWMRKGREREAEGFHGDEDCDACDAAEPDPSTQPYPGFVKCEEWDPFVAFRDRITRARSSGCAALLADIRDKAAREKGGARVMLELARSLYPDIVRNPNQRGGRKYKEAELLGTDEREHLSTDEELDLEAKGAAIERSRAQTRLAEAQREALGRSGSYFDRLVIGLAQAVAGEVGTVATGAIAEVEEVEEVEITASELAEASPSAAYEHNGGEHDDT